MSPQQQNRREFLTSGVAGLAALAFSRSVQGTMTNLRQDEPFPELVEVTIADLQAKMRSGTMTSKRIVEMYLERIKILDPKTRSVIEINPDAIVIAERLDAERKRGKVRSMLHGIPILIKDNID